MFSEFQQVLNQGGPILWALIILGIGLYTILASTWLGLRKVKSELADYQVVGGDKRQTSRQFAAFELERLAWVERRIPFIGVLAGSSAADRFVGNGVWHVGYFFWPSGEQCGDAH